MINQELELFSEENYVPPPYKSPKAGSFINN